MSGEVNEVEVLGLLRRGHRMSISSAYVADDATLYGMAAIALERVMKERDELKEDLREKKNDAREASERRSWARLVPEDVLYPDEFGLLGTVPGVGMIARLEGNRIYHRNFEALLQPIPGQVWRHDASGRTFLVLATAEYQHHAVIDVVEYVGPIPTPREV